MTTAWIKLARDMRDTPGRYAMIVSALGASIAGVTTMFSTWLVLSGEVPRNYRATNPASAQLELGAAVTERQLARVRSFPNVRMASAAAAVGGRLQTRDGAWMPLRLFVVQRFASDSIGTVAPEAGAWPAPIGSLLIERSALALTGRALGESVLIEVQGMGRRTVALSGTVHDPAVAPAWQEQTVYGYVEQATLDALGATLPLDLVKLVVREGATDAAAIERTARGVAAMLTAEGARVHELRIPPPQRHPHQSQMDAVIRMLLMFSALALALGALLTATIIASLLAQQVRQIAIMKTIGATSGQINLMYLTLVAGLAAASVALGLPAGLWLGRQFIGVTAQLLNLEIASYALPWWMYGSTIATGLALPLLATLTPIRIGAYRTIRQSLDASGMSSTRSAGHRLEAAARRMPFTSPPVVLALRNAVRRRGRLLLTVLPLAGAGGMCITSLNLRAAWEEMVHASARGRQYSVEVGLERAVPSATVESVIASVAGVARVESWSKTRVTVADTQRLALSRTYPDGAHGGFTLRAAPAATRMISHEMIAGRWLANGDRDAAVLNTMASAGPFRGRRVGDSIAVQLDDRVVMLRVVGITRELLTGGAVYVTPATFEGLMARPGATNAVRVAYTNHEAGAVPVPDGVDATIGRAITAALERAGIAVSSVVSESRFATAQSGHVYILVVALALIALIMVAVGLLGLSSSLGVSVLERTRELGVMRAIGASGTAIRRMILLEGLVVALLSGALSLVLSVPLSLIVGRVLASVAAQQLTLRLSPFAVLVWCIVVVVGSAAVSVWPATRAARMTIRQTFAVN